MGAFQLCVPDFHGGFVEIAGTVALAAVGAYGAGDKRQGIFVQNDLKGLVIPALAGQCHIGGNFLMDGAGILAGGGVTVHQRYFFR